MRNGKYIILFIIGVCIIRCAPSISTEIDQAYNALPKKIDFNLHVKPILSDKCFACHGPDQGKVMANLQLHTEEKAYAELEDSPGSYAVVPKNLKKSELYHRIISDDADYIMPPPESNLALSAHEKAVLIKWIKSGAEYKAHWAFIPPKLSKLPKIHKSHSATNDIDHFIIARLEQEGLSPSQEAQKSILLRRLTLDVIGLPPTEKEIESFQNDTTSNAYEKQVDRLLSSPHYGEKMAMDWMDLARFADTHGYTVDRYRDMSPWRDWVITAFNENMPYDNFVIEQLAGDLLPNASKNQLIATGFNRLHPQNMEGGIIDEEYRVEYVADRTAVLGTGLLAMTVACARCHDHKYDPISQKEHYELFSFFNQINESGQISWDSRDMPVPTMLLPTPEIESIINFLDEEIKQSEDSLAIISNQAYHLAEQWIASEEYGRENFNQLKQMQVAEFPLDGSLKAKNNTYEGQMKRVASPKEVPGFTTGHSNQGLHLDGDAWLDLQPIGRFSNTDPFSIGLWINIPADLDNGVIFHKCDGAKLHNFKGYHLQIKDGKLEMMLAHTAPDNAIIKTSDESIPRDKWIHLLMTYDGSGKANGLTLYLDGTKVESDDVHDNLYKNITYGRPEQDEPGLQIGARWRGFGIRNAIVDDIIVFNDALSELEVLWIYDNNTVNQILQKASEVLDTNDKALLRRHYLIRKSKAVQQVKNKLHTSRRIKADSLEAVQEVMVMKEMSEPRTTFVLERGQYNEYGDTVYPNTPAAILPFPNDYPTNRLGLAKWLFHEDHPLTARVAVNRYWQMLFGRGIVNTSEDFGNQGELPSHPELLDYLSIAFMESGWDVKQLIKKMVMSQTYRQSTFSDPLLMEKDPDNILLARGPSSRLSSEMIRDNALLASNLMNKTIGGESVKPYQPDDLWKMNGGTYLPDSGQQLYRRSLYTFWKRTVPHPTLATFDQPDRSMCTIKRQKTNTPLQALVLLNDPTFIEAARKLGEEITLKGNTKEAIQSIFVKLTGRRALEKEMEILVSLQQDEYNNLKSKSDNNRGWLTTGAYEIDKNLDLNWVTANAIVASAVINSDASITKR